MLLLTLASLLVWLPLLLLLSAALMPEDELLWRYLSPLGIGKAPVRAALLPSYPSLEAFTELLIRSPGFFVMFWNSCIQVIPVAAGQFLIGAPAAWAFARFRFPGKKQLFGIYVILNGHISPGGGFSGGAIIGAGLILYTNAYGFEKTERFFTKKTYTGISVSALSFYYTPR